MMPRCLTALSVRSIELQLLHCTFKQIIIIIIITSLRSSNSNKSSSSNIINNSSGSSNVFRLSVFINSLAAFFFNCHGDCTGSHQLKIVPIVIKLTLNRISSNEHCTGSHQMNIVPILIKWILYRFSSNEDCTGSHQTNFCPPFYFEKKAMNMI